MKSFTSTSQGPIRWTRFAGAMACALLAGCLAGGVGGLGLDALGFGYGEPPRQRQAFDSAQWKDLWASQPARLMLTVRRTMAPDLIERVLVPGTTRAQAHEWLGAPNRWTVLDTRPGFSKEDESWWLGEATVGDEWLVLDFDDKDQLVKTFVVNCCEGED